MSQLCPPCSPMPVPPQVKDPPSNSGTLILHCYTGLKLIHVIDFCCCSCPQAKLANGAATVQKSEQNLTHVAKPVPVRRRSCKVTASACVNQKQLLSQYEPTQAAANHGRSFVFHHTKQRCPHRGREGGRDMYSSAKQKLMHIEEQSWVGKRTWYQDVSP